MRCPAGIYSGGVLKFLLVAALFALVVYLTIRVIERRGIRRPGDGGGQREPRRPLGPDDDPDFLWNLDKKKRHPDEPGEPSE